MGRIKTQLIKRLTFQLLKEYRPEFSVQFSENKAPVERHLTTASKRVRNSVAGFVTRIMRSKEELV